MNEQLSPQQKAANTRKKNKELKDSLQESNGNEPEVVAPQYTKSFSVSRELGGWFFITTTLDGDKVIHQDKIGPTMRAIVLDEFKMTAQRYFETMES